MKFENEEIEFKGIFTPDIYKEVVAFANAGGGTIFVGVNDNGELSPLADYCPEFLLKISEMEFHCLVTVNLPKCFTN